MRIAEIAPPWIPLPPRGYGGIELVVHQLAERLTASGHDVTLFAAPGTTSRARVVSPLPAVPPPDALGDPWTDAAHALDAFRNVEDFDVIHDHSGVTGLALAAALALPPVVHTIHGAWTDRNRALYQLAAGHVGYVAISHTQRRGNPELPYLGVVHNGIDPDDYPFGGGDRNGLAFIGRACPDKAPDEAIRIARATDQQLTMIVKRHEPAEQEYWDAVVRPLLGSDVTVLSDVDHQTKTAVLGAASAFVFPLQWDEPFGLVMVEALACGTPVVARPLGAASEIVIPGVTGFLGSSTSELAAAVRKVDAIDHEGCRQAVVERFSAARMAQDYERLLADVATHARSVLA